MIPITPPYHWLVSLILGVDILHKFVLGFLLHVQPNKKLFFEAWLTQGIFFYYWMLLGLLKTHFLSIVLRRFSMFIYMLVFLPVLLIHEVSSRYIYLLLWIILFNIAYNGHFIT